MSGTTRRGSGPLDVGVIAWGSTFGAALEAVQEAQRKGVKAGALKVVSLYPYHAGHIRAFMRKCRHVLVPELNLEGQLATLIGHLHGEDVKRFNRVTGVPFAPGEILGKIEELL